MKIRSEKGIALPLVMIAMMVGAIIIPAFLGRVGNGLVGSRHYSSELQAQYTCDAAAEHAIWNLTDGGLDAVIPNPGDTSTYALDEQINDLSASIKVSNAWETIAYDDFESAGWAGGAGWLGGWNHSGDALVTTTGTPYEGSYHLRLRSSTGSVSRAVDLSKQVEVRLVFQAKVNSFEAGDTAVCRISPDGNTWTTLKTWTNADSDSAYHNYDFEITSYGLSPAFYVSFISQMNSTFDYFYVDDLQVIWPAADLRTIAQESFESGGWAGGTGWLDSWISGGAAGVSTLGVPYNGSYHLRLQGPDGYAMRTVDLSSASIARLRFWAKSNSFEAGDEAYCGVSIDGSDWDIVRTWVDGEDDNAYHYYDIDITGYAMVDEVWIAFAAGMDTAFDSFYVDNISIDAMRAYCITVTAGDRTLKAVVDLLDGTADILCWWFVS